MGVGANLRDEVERVVRGESDDASRILGPHWVERDGKRALVLRAFRPGAMEGSIFWRGNSKPQAMTEIHPGGMFEAVGPSRVADSHEEAVAPLHGAGSNASKPALASQHFRGQSIDFADGVPAAISICGWQFLGGIRSLRVSAAAHGLRLVPFGRRHTLPEIRKAGCARAGN